MNLIDSAEFRTAALHFEMFGCYTKLTPGTSAWRSFWIEEHRRCIEGYHIGRDYITGYLYDYLNYSPIMIAVDSEKQIELKDNVKADRIEGFPNFSDGLYDFAHYIEEGENSGQHGELIGSRGKGKSYFAASMGNRNYFHLKGSKSFYIGGSDIYITSGDGILPKVWGIMNFRDVHTPWGKLRQYKDKNDHKRSSKQINQGGLKIEGGFMSEIIGFTVGDDPDKVRGLRGKLIVLEEVGNFPKVIESWNSLLKSQKIGNKVIGYNLAIGTGGTVGAAFEGAEEMFRNPEAYQIHPIVNKWEINQENSKIGFFWPADISFDGCYDPKTGVSDIISARKIILQEREKRKKASDPFAVIRLSAEWPLSPSEALMRISGTQFPIRELRQQEAEIETKPFLYRNADYVGRFDLNKDSQSYEFIIDEGLSPIYKFPIGNNKNLPGAVVIHSHPLEDAAEDRYIAGIDSYDFDESTTTSLGSIFIMDSWTKKIVAEYTGRPNATEFYETCRRLCLYYNALVNIENGNKGIFDYFEKMGSYYLICEEPRVAKEAISDDRQKGTNRRGTYASEPLNQYARGLIAEWLLTKTKNEDKVEELYVHTLRGIALVKELIGWNVKGNFDRVSALGMALLLLKDREVYSGEAEIKLDYTKMDKNFIRMLSKNPKFANKFNQYNFPGYPVQIIRNP